MARTRAQTKKLLSKRKSYRKRVKTSKCRSKPRYACAATKGCKLTKSGKRKTYCRKSSNHKVRTLKGGARTRAQTKKLLSKRRSYRRRVKTSKCRGLTRTCRKAKGCTMTKSGKRKSYCRRVKNHKKR